MKTERLTVRMPEEEYKMLLYITEKTGISKSTYVRQAVNGKIHRDINYGNGEGTGYVDGNIISHICKVSTLCNQIIEKYPLEGMDKKELEREMDEVWKLLKRFS